tara:strand:+ start:54529 stop:55752 length:1224 start_codon:yes stop_codon:yes gene_type:complete
VTASYWGFTITDGALRMLVLLHFHTLGYKPLDLAILFLLYEAMGIMTNLFGGWLGVRFGLRLTLFAGLLTQIIALLMLSVMPADITVGLSVVYVMASQALSGIAKDLTKMSSKSAVKVVVTEDDQGTLFKWVSILTGSKNALKGAGFFIGGLLLQEFGFQGALTLMAGGLFIILVACTQFLKDDLGKSKKTVKFKEIFSKTREINYLSAARIFLFASRDVWFVVGVPVFLASTAGWNYNQVGAFMASWIIGYGIVQACVPNLLRRRSRISHVTFSAKVWCFILLFIPILIALGLSNIGSDWLSDQEIGYSPASWLVIGLAIFGVVFAINSTVHSYLIVAYSDADKASLSIGFYYMANALGRLIGTFLSGFVFQYWGLLACLIISSIMVLIALFLTLPLGLVSDEKAN